MYMYVLCMYVCTMYVCMYVCMYVLCMYVCMLYVYMLYLCMYNVCIYVCIYIFIKDDSQDGQKKRKGSSDSDELEILEVHTFTSP